MAAYSWYQAQSKWDIQCIDDNASKQSLICFGVFVYFDLFSYTWSAPEEISFWLWEKFYWRYVKLIEKWYSGGTHTLYSVIMFIIVDI